MPERKNWLTVNNENDPIGETIIALATNRGNGKTICPSEVARTLWPGDWRKHMPEVREAAFVLREKGQIRILQKGADVSENVIKGPVRIQIR